jgi:hypothetical protein
LAGHSPCVPAIHAFVAAYFVNLTARCHAQALAATKSSPQNREMVPMGKRRLFKASWLQ